MPSHPLPATIAKQLRRLAKLLDEHGDAAIDLAGALASRGLPSNTLGSGSRSASTTTSTERAAGTDSDTGADHRWDNVDQDLDRYLRVIWKAGADVDSLITRIVSHASDVDVVPAGTGSCVCCHELVRPTAKRPDNRLRAGLCPTCHSAWMSWKKTHQPERAAFIATRRRRLGIPHPRDAEARSA